MEITLEKIELVKDRTGVSYREAKEALESADGSVVDAIIAIEETIDEKSKGKFSEHSANVIASIKEAVKKGNVSKIIVKKDEDVVMNLPLNVGIVGTVLAPWAMIAGVIAAFGTKCVIELVKEDGSIYDISEMANETFGDFVEKGTTIADEVKVKGNDVYKSVKGKATEAMSKVKKDEDDLDFDFDDNCDCGDDCTCDEDDKDCNCKE